MIPKVLEDYLQSENADYEVIAHENLPEMPQEIAKAVVLSEGEDRVMVVLPQSAKFDLETLRFLLDRETLSFDSPEDLMEVFPDCKPEALPALGIPYNVPCYLDETLLDGPDIFIESGNLKDVIKLSSDEYLRVSHAEVGDFYQHKAIENPFID